MDVTKVLSLLDQLDDEVDDLEETLDPLVKTALSETTSKLPLLDKAKLYVLITYAIESILFSYLRLHGVKARQHPVFTELNRVKQYFEKVKLAENPTEQRANLSLDKSAASRIIKAGLIGNDRYDLERAEQQAKERARAHIKLKKLSETIKQDELSKKRKSEDLNTDSIDSELDSSSVEATEGFATAPVHPPKKKRVERSKDLSDSLPSSASDNLQSKEKDKKTSKHKKKYKKNKREPQA